LCMHSGDYDFQFSSLLKYKFIWFDVCKFLIELVLKRQANLLLINQLME
jgi:hypothetical protein